MDFVVIKALVMTGGCLCLLGLILVLVHFHRENYVNPSKALAVLAALVFFVCGRTFELVYTRQIEYM